AKLGHLLLVVAMHPARGGHRHRLEAGVDVVLVLQPVGDHLALQTPTAPRIRSFDISGRKNWVAPSSDNCARPFCSAFIFSGSRSRARRKSSGAKFGMPVKLIASPSVKLSPMVMVPWLCRPITSPGYAVSTISRS